MKSFRSTESNQNKICDEIIDRKNEFVDDLNHILLLLLKRRFKFRTTVYLFSRKLLFTIYHFCHFVKVIAKHTKMTQFRNRIETREFVYSNTWSSNECSQITTKSFGLRLGAIQTIRDTRGGGFKIVSPNDTWGRGGGCLL